MLLGLSLLHRPRRLLLSVGLSLAPWALVPPVVAQGPAAPATRDAGPDFAHQLLRDRRYDLAAEEYEKYLKDHPAGPGVIEARHGLATARLFLGQSREARQEFEKFLEIAPADHPNVPAARFRVGETAYMLGDLPGARKALEQFVAASPGHGYLETAWPYLGDVRYRLGDLTGAREAYSRAIEDFPKGRLVDRARYGLARVRAAQGEIDPALELFGQVVATAPADWAEKARFQIGLINLEADRAEPAIAAFEELERASPRSPMVPEARLRRAEALNRLGRYAEADALLAPLAEGDGRLAPAAAYALALARREQGKPAEALKITDTALDRDPDSPMTPLLLFRSAEIAGTLGSSDAERAGAREDARTRYLKLVEAYPDDPWADDALLRAAELALKDGQPDLAGELASRFAVRYAESPLRPNARLIEGQAALDAGKPDAAIALLEPLLDPAPGAPVPAGATPTAPEPERTAAVARAARLSLGMAYRAAGKPERSAEILDGLLDGPGADMSPDARYIVGLNHYEAGRYDEATAALQTYLDAAPKGPLAADALAMIAISRQELGDSDAARAALDRLAAEFPESPALTPTRLRLGEAALDANQHDRAAQLLQLAAAGAADPALKARALAGLGWALLGTGQASEAADAFAEALAAAPEDPRAAESALAHGWALEKAEQPDAALAAYELVRDRYSSSDRAPLALLARARLLDRLERPEEAAKAYEDYLKAPISEPEDSDTLDSVLAEWGWVLLGAGKRPEADAAFRRVLEEFSSSPHAADARLILAESAHQAGDHSAVESLLAPLVEADASVEPERVQSALFRLGLVRFDLRDWPAARAAFDRVIKDFPESPLRARAQFWAAESAYQAQDAAGAEAGFAALLADEVQTQDAEAAAWRPTVRLRYAESLNQLKRWAEALQEADALKAEQPDFPAMHELDYARGQALQGLARFDEARVAYQAVIDANRADDFAARARFMRGETFFHQERYNDALKEFLRVEYDYDVPSLEAAALFEAGQVAERLGRWDDAAGFYRKVTSNHPEDPMAAQAAERLTVVLAKTGAPAGPGS